MIAHDVLRVNIPAPSAYSSPASISPVRLIGEWEFKHFDSSGWFYTGRPLDIAASAGGSPGSTGCSGPLKPQGLSRIICVRVGLSNTTTEQVTLARPLIIPVAIRAVGPVVFTGPIIWQGTLPPLSGTIMAREGVVFSFKWDQRDAAERQVPPGSYKVFIPNPIAAHYIIAGQSGQETLEESSPAGASSFIIP